MPSRLQHGAKKTHSSQQGAWRYTLSHSQQGPKSNMIYCLQKGPNPRCLRAYNRALVQHFFMLTAVLRSNKPFSTQQEPDPMLSWSQHDINQTFLPSHSRPQPSMPPTHSKVLAQHAFLLAAGPQLNGTSRSQQGPTIIYIAPHGRVQIRHTLLSQQNLNQTSLPTHAKTLPWQAFLLKEGNPS